MRDSRTILGTGRSFLLALFYFCCIALIGYAAVRQGLSHYYADAAFVSGSDAQAVAAIQFEPENPDAYKTRGVIFLRNKDFPEAAGAFEQAIRLRPNDFLLWLRLGYSRFQMKDFDAAEKAYRRALDLAPNYSQPNYYMGNMLLETGRHAQAFGFLSKAAEYDKELFPEVLHRARTIFPDDPEAIERSINPSSFEARKSLARYLIKHHFMTENVKSFLLGDELSDDEKNAFVQYLLYKQDFEVAREVWLSKSKGGNGPSNELIYDGGFENITETDASGLGWQIDQRMAATSVARDQKVVHSGSNALFVKFAGDVPINTAIVSQLVFVEPRHKYQLKVFVRSPELISAGPPAIAVVDGVTKDSLGRTASFEPTENKWVEYSCEFVTKEAPVVRITLQRTNCNTSPCPIFGELSLDDFSITSGQNAGAARPQ